MRRVISLWLPRFATDRLDRGRDKPPDGPFALVLEARARLQLSAVNRAAERAGLAPGMALATARALVPTLITKGARPRHDAKALEALAAWCGRYSPWTAADISLDGVSMGGMGMGGGGGLWLDCTGCAHLFGGEDTMLADLTGRLAANGFTNRAAMADAPGAAWAMARFAPSQERWTVVQADGNRQALAPLPVAGLRLAAAHVAALSGLGIRRIGDLLDMPRAPLAARFGETVARRLDMALGRAFEPVSPRPAASPHVARLAFAEPVGRAEDMAAGLERLLGDLCKGLETAGHGARRLTLALYRTDGSAQHMAVGTARPSRHGGHLLSLFAEHLDQIDAGFGIEVMTLAATATEALGPRQLAMTTNNGTANSGTADEDIAALLDRLGNRLGTASVRRFATRQSHLPERASALVPIGTASMGARTGEKAPPRPLRLFPHPEPVEAVADALAPPVLFRWRRGTHLVASAEGPERIAPEWWRDGGGGGGECRDYYRIEDTEGRRFWLYRQSNSPDSRSAEWYLHGMFG